MINSTNFNRVNELFTIWPHRNFITHSLPNLDPQKYVCFRLTLPNFFGKKKKKEEILFVTFLSEIRSKDFSVLFILASTQDFGT